MPHVMVFVYVIVVFGRKVLMNWAHNLIILIYISFLGFEEFINLDIKLLKHLFY